MPREYDVVLTKALLAHSAGWEGALSSYKAALKSSQNDRQFKEYVGRFLGLRVCQPRQSDELHRGSSNHARFWQAR